MLESKIECLGPQRGGLHWAKEYTVFSAWATKQTTNDGRSFALPITVKKSVSKGFCSA